jgi:chitosanase
MDIDCDGVNRSAGACANDQTGQDQTAFMDTVKTFGIPDLDANVHPYVVFGNAEAVPSFVPQDHDIKPLSVMAVICNDQVVSTLFNVMLFLLFIDGIFSITESGAT